MKKIRTFGDFIKSMPMLTLAQKDFVAAMNAAYIRESFDPHTATAFTWCVEDVQEVAQKCSIKKGVQVLSLAHDRHDAEVGINWDVLREHAEEIGLAPKYFR